LSALARNPATGHLAENVLHFVRVLRAAGLALGPAKVLDALAAVEAAGIVRREDFRAALSAVLVARRDQVELFEQALRPLLAAPAPGREDDRLAPAPRALARGHAAAAGDSRKARAGAPGRAGGGKPIEPDRELELDAAFTFSPREVLQMKDFATMSAEELAEVRKVIARLELPLPRIPPAPHRAFGARPRRRPARHAARHDGRRGHRRAARAPHATKVPPPLVILCDFSGSMDRLRANAAAFPPCNRERPAPRARAHVRHAAYEYHAPPQASRRRRSARPGDASRGRLVGRNAHRRIARYVQSALVATPARAECGRAADQRRLDADAGAGLDFEMERLAKSCARLIWLNPLLRYAGFEARPAGIRAMLPHVDDFLRCTTCNRSPSSRRRSLSLAHAVR
jgi:uncharacterized protein with von Willebrand factor type A (vWA) domain